MKTYTLSEEQFLPVELQKAWDFFSSPKNLAVITPPDLGFTIKTILADVPVYAGLEIEYTVRPLFGIPVKWKTLISEVDNLHYFTDKQMKGPYKLWEHTHTFKTVDNGVLMTDFVKYQLPFGILGEVMHALVVKNRVRDIFNYRRKVLDKMFVAVPG